MCINHERIFEASHLANEMVSGAYQDIPLLELLHNIFSMRQGKLGKVFVKFCEPINLNEYVEQHKQLSQPDLQLKLTRDLYFIQKREHPITMNSLVVSSIMHHPKN